MGFNSAFKGLNRLFPLPRLWRLSLSTALNCRWSTSFCPLNGLLYGSARRCSTPVFNLWFDRYDLKPLWQW